MNQQSKEWLTQCAITLLGHAKQRGNKLKKDLVGYFGEAVEVETLEDNVHIVGKGDKTYSTTSCTLVNITETEHAMTEASIKAGSAGPGPNQTFQQTAASPSEAPIEVIEEVSASSINFAGCSAGSTLDRFFRSLCNVKLNGSALVKKNLMPVARTP